MSKIFTDLQLPFPENFARCLIKRHVLKENILFGTFTGNAATKYGIANEITAKEQLEDLLKQKNTTCEFNC